MLEKIQIPDIGQLKGVTVIEISVAVGDTLEQDTTLLTLETDKATMEIPSPFAGVLKALHIKVGDKVSEGDVVGMMEIQTQAEPKTEIQPLKETQVIPEIKPAIQPHSVNAPAGPAVRRLARELNLDLAQMTGTGRNNRIMLSDVYAYLKSTASSSATPMALDTPAWPEVDFAQFGEIEKQPISRIQKLSGAYLHRNWIRVPHVTQFDEADITDMEAFRKAQTIKLTPLVFIMKAVVSALQAFPTFNASLDSTGAELILKKYFHLGIAMDTPQGLVVPVVREVDKKSMTELAQELTEMSARAREGKLKAQEMQGSSFTISSLGGIGGTAFTPIINVPDVAILGVSRASTKPVYEDHAFVPRLMLPLSLSYDHRVIDGAIGARFITYLVRQLSDIRRLLL
jgi:pyruvate dehydrogenase E2 component (dihydrolipoamide acetyltransferase)